MNHHRIVVARVLFAVSLLLGTGCTSVERTFPNHPPDTVWRAAVAAAESPTYYSDWHMIENEVWADRPGNRIEIYRRLVRDEIPAMSRPHRARRELKITVNMLETETGEPLVEFVSRHVDVPAIARDEAKLYFEDMQEILGGAPLPPPSGGQGNTGGTAGGTTGGTPSMIVPDDRPAPPPAGIDSVEDGSGSSTGDMQGDNDDDVDNTDVPIDIDDI